MPWLTLWVDPIPFTTHGGVTIYHTYNDMEATSGLHPYCFTTQPSDAEEKFYFDVRDLPGAARLRSVPMDMPDAEYALIREIVHDAIDCGLLCRNLN